MDAFVDAAKAFRPAASKSDLAEMFAVRERSQAEDSKTRLPIAAPLIKSAASLWSNDTRALVFASATLPTVATRSAVGVLFLLCREGGFWRVKDARRFYAEGKYAEVSAKLTAGADSERLLPAGVDPIITIKESRGGRGYSHRVDASYTFDAFGLKRIDLD